MPFQHVHLGAGALGLGLICPVVIAAGGRCTLLNRASPTAQVRLDAISSKGGYYLHPYGGKAGFVAVAAASTYEDADFAQLAGGSGDLLLTTALKREGILGSLPVIRRLLEHRGSRPTVVLAGENQVDTVFLKEQLTSRGFVPNENTLFVRGVVDRICNKPTVEDGCLEVTCEGFGRIYVERVSNFLIRALAKTAPWELVDDFDYVVERKKWIVNASHLLMALVAHYYRHPSVKSFTAQEFGARLLDKAVSELTALVVSHYENSSRRSLRSELLEFAPFVKKRIASFPQRYPDVVTRFDGPARLPVFFEDFHRKITELSLARMHRATTAPYFTSLVTHIVVDLIKEQRWIRDARPN